MLGKRLTSFALGAALLCSAPWSHALTIGKVRGAAWIGQPLDLVVPVELDADQNTSDLCAQVDLFQGDTHLDSSLVRISVEPGPQPDNLLLHVRASAKVDEPVVTLNLRLGCAQKTTRRLVLLADYPNANANNSGTANAPVTGGNATPESTARTALNRPAPRPVAAAPDSDGIELTLASSLSLDSQALRAHNKKKHRAHHAATPEATSPLHLRATPPRDSRASAEVASKPHKPRLRLDPVETPMAPVPATAGSSASAPAPEAPSMPRSPEAQQLESLQSDLKGLIEQAAKNEQTMVALRARLERSESDRGPVILAYSLLTLIALTLLGVLALWARRHLPLLQKRPTQD